MKTSSKKKLAELDQMIEKCRGFEKSFPGTNVTELRAGLEQKRADEASKIGRKK